MPEVIERFSLHPGRRVTATLFHDRGRPPLVTLALDCDSRAEPAAFHADEVLRAARFVTLEMEYPSPPERDRPTRATGRWGDAKRR